MKAEILKETKEYIIVRWTDEKIGFGELTMQWNSDMGRFIIDSEMLGIKNTLRIIQSLPKNV